jgi:hypothetical protein
VEIEAWRGVERGGGASALNGSRGVPEVGALWSESRCSNRPWKPQTYDHLDVKVDGQREDLGTEVTGSELLDKVRVFHGETLGELHGSEGEDEVGDL